MCGVEICPVHTRTTMVVPIEDGVPARAITYYGDYAVCTLDNPEFSNPMAALSFLLGEAEGMEKMFLQLVVKVGPTGTLSDVLEADGIGAATVFRDTFLEPGDARLTEFNGEGPSQAFNDRLTKILFDTHEMTLDSVQNGIIS
jgi:hypothetical protein